MIPATDGPLEIFVDIFIFEVSKINDIELTMTFELYFDLMWEEKRFVINETSDKWGQVIFLTLSVIDWVPRVQLNPTRRGLWNGHQEGGGLLMPDARIF